MPIGALNLGANLTLWGVQALGICRRVRHRLKALQEGIRGRADLCHRYDL